MISWQAPADNGDSAIINYNILRCTSSRGEAWFETIGNFTSCTGTSVVNGQAYYYTVIAINGAGAGVQASEASASVPATQSSPSSASGLNAADDMVFTIAIVTCIAVIVVAFLIDFRNKKMLATIARTFQEGPSKSNGKKGGSRYTDDAISTGDSFDPGT